MSLQPPNIQIPIVEQNRMTPQFLKFLGDLSTRAPGSVSGRVDTLETEVAALTASLASFVGIVNTALTGFALDLATLTTQVTNNTDQLANLPIALLNTIVNYDPPNLLALGTTTTTVTVTGAALGMAAMASFDLDTQGVVLTAAVTSADTVTVILFNPTALAVNLGAGNLEAFVWS